MSSAIKVVSGSAARRITVKQTTEWSDLIRTLTTLFNLPANTSAISLSYTDADDDTITLDTTTELQDAIAQGITKFRLNDVANPGDWVLDGTETPRTFTDTASVRSGLESLRLVNQEETREEIPAPPQYTTTVEEEAEVEEPEEQQPYVEKGKQKEGTPSKSPRQPQTEQPNQAKDNEPPQFVKITQQLEKLMEQFRDVLEQNPQLVATAHELMDQINENIPVDIENFATLLNGQRDGESPFDFVVQFGGPFGGPDFRRGPFGGPHPGPGCHGGPFGGLFGGPRFGPDCPRGSFGGPFSSPYGRPCGPRGPHGGCPRRCPPKGEPTEGDPAKGESTEGEPSDPVKKAYEERARAWNEARRRRCGGDNKELTEEQKKAHEERIRAWNEARAEAWLRRWGGAQQSLSAEELKTKIGQLNAMGFHEEDAEDLLNRYNGNVERVVEVIVQRQNASTEAPAPESEKPSPYMF